MKPKFELGRVVMTTSVHTWWGRDPELQWRLAECLQRHNSGDWGEVCDDDKRENDFSVENGLRVLSAYTIEGQKIWVITEADRSVTTVLFPEDY